MDPIDATREPVLIGSLLNPLLRNLAGTNPDTLPDSVHDKLAEPSTPHNK
ncbi:hypothetical protein [Schaalia sp. lx-100]|nr:hypothetical protein [Schaalia sp. lx-100]MCD4557715.1 hypothetical protein [Schaalia sp. lx-100]